MAIKLYTKQFARMLPDLFESKAKFYRAFGGNLQTIIGAEADANYLSIKVSDTDVVIQDYSTNADVAFGTGTADTNRFGPRKEIITEDETVAYDTPLAIHEGIDSFTVNDIPAQVIAERLALHGVAWAEKYDKVLSAYIVSKKGKLYDDVVKSESGLAKLFSDAYQWFINKGVSQSIRWVAYVDPEVYDMLVESKLASILKGANVDIGAQALYAFKGFILEPVPTAKFETGYIAYFLPDNVGVAGVAIPVARTLDSEAFAGVAIQAAGKLGKYIPEKNEAAIIVAKFGDPPPAPDLGNLRFVAKDGDGAGVRNVAITIGEETVNTNAHGIALFADLEAGEVNWTAAKADYDLTDASGTATVVKDTTVVVSILAEAHTGTAKFATNPAVEDAKVTIDGQEYMTDSGGEADIELLVGEHTWTIEKDNYTFDPATDTVTITKGADSPVAITSTFDLGNLRFVAKDGDGAGVRNVAITIGEDEALTNEHGITLFEDLAAGEITWTASKDNCDITTATGTTTVVKDETVVVNIEANDHKGTAKFTVKTGAEAAIQDAKITIDEVEEETDASGVAEFTLLVGEHDWTIAKTDYSFVPPGGKVTVTKGAETPVAVTGTDNS